MRTTATVVVMEVALPAPVSDHGGMEVAMHDLARPQVPFEVVGWPGYEAFELSVPAAEPAVEPRAVPVAAGFGGDWDAWFADESDATRAAETIALMTEPEDAAPPSLRGFAMAIVSASAVAAVFLAGVTQ